ncbi:MAG: beta-galactosidase [Candidatus Hydrogenedentota bacterium]
MNLGVQYYRAPFPTERYWEDDFARIKDSGLNTVQLWVLWGWVEAKSRTFRFDDYDRLMELAEKYGLGVVLSTIAEIHPYWIHREEPGSEMIDHMGRVVVSSNRGECHFGLTPGGCFDHTGVWARMRQFLAETTARYRDAPCLRGWDAWNELRWNVQADGLVCYCENTLRAFHDWLEDTYDTLDDLNRVWIRRYNRFDEILPGKLPKRPYTEMMAFNHFLTWRACRHAAARYEIIKSIDANHPVTVHGAAPSALYAGSQFYQALDRGNDWFFADQLDGIGCSSFPKWGNIDDADFGLRVEFVKSAARGKRVWLSEVQGGRASTGFDVHEPVDAPSQQRWLWNGVACGADTILFWCWRDEVFGRESAGFGLAGADGRAEERLAAMKKTGALLEQHADLLSAYEPVGPEIGVLFSPQAYYLHYAQEGHATRAADALTGYARALVRCGIPYRVIEEAHLDALQGLKALFLPRCIVTSKNIEEALIAFVEEGGILVCESECGAFNPQGLYRYPEDRFLARLCGVREIGRRRLTSDAIALQIGEESLELAANQWLTPYAGAQGEVWASHPDGPLAMRIPAGKGQVIVCGAYLGDAYRQRFNPGFEEFLEHIAREAGWQPHVEVVSPARTQDAFVYIKHGSSNGKRVVFVFFPGDAEEAKLRFKSGFFTSQTMTDFISGEEVRYSQNNECTLAAGEWRLRVLAET